MASTRKHMIEIGEALIVIDAYDGKHIFRETAFFEEFGGFDFIRDFLGDKTIEIRRINTITWEKAEEFTEDCAYAWLMDADAEYALDYSDRDQCESIMPLYVKNSKAWARWIDDVEAEAPINMVREWGTHSTSNGHAS